jgi:Tfp pilus assembly protein PilF
MKTLMLCVALLTTASLSAQSVKELLETGNSLMQGGDFANAINVLNKAYQKDPTNLEVVKSLAYAYFLNKDYAKSLSTIKPVLDSADDQGFQIAGNNYVALAENKEAERLYKQALKRFPNSGPLYSDYGIFLGSLARQYEAIKVWEKGIEMDPSYPGNYYYASKFYYPIDVLWSVIYGEVFVNMESLTRRTPEIKALLMDSYKKLFSGDGTNLQPLVDKKGNALNPFENAVRATFRANASAVTEGVNVETLTSLRSRFILEWFNKYATQFPYRLYDYQRQLLQQGMFAAYNQWIFGYAQDEKAYDDWVSAHQSEFTTYNNFARGRVFKIPQGEYYQTKEKE